jgi:hypothetical protein
MRTALIVMIAMAGTVMAQPRPAEVANPAPRFNVLFNDRFYQQATPQLALEAVIKAARLKQYDYMAAYLFETAAADAAIAARAATFTAATESDLRAARRAEKADPFKPAVDNPLPVDPRAFAERVNAEATVRGFAKVVSEIRERFEDDPSHNRDLQFFLRNGELAIQDTTAKLSVATIKDRAIYFKKIGTKWFVEDRIVEPAAPKQ